MEKKKRIIIVHEYGYINGGAAKIAIETAIGLHRRGYDVTYFCACGPIDLKLKDNVRVVCLNQFDLVHNPSRFKAAIQGIWNRKAYRILDKTIKEYQDNSNVIVHIHGYSHALSVSIIKACNDNGIEPFITLHDYFPICPNGGLYNFKKNKICTLRPMSKGCIFCNCDSRSNWQKVYRIIRQCLQDKYIKKNKKIRFFYITNFSWAKIRPYLIRKNGFYLHNPIDIEPRESYSEISEDRKIYLFVGRLSPEKGVELFCRAITTLKYEGIVVGDGPEICLSSEYPQISFVGWKNSRDIQKYFQRTKYLVFPSKWYETDGLVVQEALSYGIPCIVSKNCAASEYITDGQNGYLFEGYNDLVSILQKADKTNLEFTFEPRSMDEYLNDLSNYYAVI